MAESPSCPSCRVALTAAGYTERCERCDGAWVHEDVLAGMLQEKTAAIAVTLPWQPREAQGGERARPCAVCGQPMQPVSLGTVALDRCALHGVWFDATELAAVLKHAREFKADPPAAPGEHHGLLDVLSRIFGGGGGH
jgi:Zn-finger nucleic acid-binding protein